VQGYAEAEKKAREAAGEVSDEERQARLAQQARAWLQKAGERGAIELASGEQSPPARMK